MLEAEGFEFVGAGSAEEGLLAYKKAAPDLVIVDLMMEEVDAGTGFAKELQLLGNDAPVFLLSSVGDNLSLTTDYRGPGPGRRLPEAARPAGVSQRAAGGAG